MTGLNTASTRSNSLSLIFSSSHKRTEKCPRTVFPRRDALVQISRGRRWIRLHPDTLALLFHFPFVTSFRGYFSLSVLWMIYYPFSPISLFFDFVYDFKNLLFYLIFINSFLLPFSNLFQVFRLLIPFLCFICLCHFQMSISYFTYFYW